MAILLTHHPWCQLDPWDQTSVKFKSQYKSFHSRKGVWTCRLRNGGHFQGEMSKTVFDVDTTENGVEYMTKRGIVQTLKSHKTPHTSSSLVNYGITIVGILESIDFVIVAPHCNWITIFMACLVPNILENIIVNSEKHLLCNFSYLVDECTGLGLDPRDVPDNFTSKMLCYLYMCGMILSSNTTNTMYTGYWLCNSWGPIQHREKYCESLCDLKAMKIF